MRIKFAVWLKNNVKKLWIFDGTKTNQSDWAILAITTTVIGLVFCVMLTMPNRLIPFSYGVFSFPIWMLTSLYFWYRGVNPQKEK
jgi:hypothetical protein